MKNQQLISGEGSLLDAESKRTFKEKLRQACETALGFHGGRSDVSITDELERRRRRLNMNKNYVAEDPIRTMMFLGSWNHT